MALETHLLLDVYSCKRGQKCKEAHSMTTVVFVHGTGTRRAKFDATFEIIRQNLLARKPDLTITPCYWGEPLGAELYAKGASIPNYARTRGPEEMTGEDYQI